MKPFLDFDDAGAGDDHPAKGVTVGDIRAWHDERTQMRAALGFAASVIKSGEPWTETCEREIGALLRRTR